MKDYRNTETLRQLELDQVVEIIRTCEYAEAVGLLRSLTLVYGLKREADGSMSGAENITSRLPRVCFASELENRKGQRIRKGYSGLVLLEVNNLSSYDEAVAVRQGAGLMPQTLLAFVGASGQSVKIVCRGEMWQTSCALPVEEDDVKRFHLNLYEKARLAYNAQLGVSQQGLVCDRF